MSSQRVGNRLGNKRKRKGKVKLRQAELVFRSWGGARCGAGRKPKGERAGMPHVSRPEHKARFPLLITSRLRPGLRSLRHESEAECIRVALSRANRAALARAGAAGSSAPFQVVHHSIQSNHLHLIVEAASRTELTVGMRSLLVRISRSLNRLWRRSGSVFADRFHERELHSPREVRNALVYVLQNLRKHGIALAGPDPLSSGPEFDGWSSGGMVSAASAATAARADEDRASMGGRAANATMAASAASAASAAKATNPKHAGSTGEGRARVGSRSRFGGDRAESAGRFEPYAALRGPRGSDGSSTCALAGLIRAARAEVPPAKTWLLGVGWRTHGLIDLRESPRRA